MRGRASGLGVQSSLQLESALPPRLVEREVLQAAPTMKKGWPHPFPTLCGLERIVGFRPRLPPLSLLDLRAANGSRGLNRLRDQQLQNGAMAFRKAHAPPASDPLSPPRAPIAHHDGGRLRHSNPVVLDEARCQIGFRIRHQRRHLVHRGGVHRVHHCEALPLRAQIKNTSMTTLSLNLCGSAKANLKGADLGGATVSQI